MHTIYAFALVVICGALAFAADPIDIGRIKPLGHGVKSGPVQVLDEKTIRVKDFYYDGKGPDAWFVVGTEDKDKYVDERPSGGLPSAQVVPDENGSCDKPGAYNGKTIELTLPGNTTVSDIKYFAMYCFKYNHNFGYVKIPSNIQASPSAHSGPTKTCRSSGNKASVSGTFLVYLPVLIATLVASTRL